MTLDQFLHALSEERADMIAGGVVHWESGVAAKHARSDQNPTRGLEADASSLTNGVSPAVGIALPAPAEACTSLDERSYP